MNARADKTRKPFRIAFGRIAQETHALSPVHTEMKDFERTVLVDGPDVLAGCAKDKHEAEGFLKNAELSGFVQQMRKLDASAELVGLLSAWTVPSGPLTDACFEELTGRLVRGLRDAGDVDAVYLSLHGAMGVVGREEADAEIVRRVREVVGPDVPIAITLDLHANVTRTMVDESDFIVAYKTNPHRDHVKAGAHCARLLARAMRSEVATTTAWRSLPMLMGGGTTLDFLPPMRAIYGRLKQLERKDPRVLAASVCMCHPWNNHQELGWSVVIHTDGDGALAEKLADELAESCWKVKDKKPPNFLSASEAVARALRSKLRRKLGVVTIADTSDVVTAGATGDSTRLLSTLLDEGQGMVSYVPLRDPEVVEHLWSMPVGEEVDIAVGGKLDPENSSPVQVQGRILKKTTSRGVERTVVLVVGTVHIVLVEGPAVAMQPSFFTNAGLSVWKADVVVVKNFFPFLLFFLPFSRRTLFVRTKGLSDFDASYVLEFAGPMHPRDEVSDWREADARRRAPPERELRAA